MARSTMRMLVIYGQFCSICVKEVHKDVGLWAVNTPVEKMTGEKDHCDYQGENCILPRFEGGSEACKCGRRLEELPEGSVIKSWEGGD